MNDFSLHPGTKPCTVACYSTCAPMDSIVALTFSRLGKNDQLDVLPVCSKCFRDWLFKQWDDHEDWVKQNITLWSQT